eukprot:ANDGO_06637.mRNA.1 hypothetical protein
MSVPYVCPLWDAPMPPIEEIARVLKEFLDAPVTERVDPNEIPDADLKARWIQNISLKQAETFSKQSAASRAKMLHDEGHQAIGGGDGDDDFVGPSISNFTKT